MAPAPDASLGCVPSTREIALLTNPTAGKGRATRARAAALPRLRDAGFRVRDLQGRDADEALDLATAVRVPTSSRPWWCAAATASSTWARRRSRAAAPGSGSYPAGTGNDVARYFDIPRKDPLAAVDRIIAGRSRRRRPGPVRLEVLRRGAVRPASTRIVNERANQMTWPRGQMRYNVATLAELRTFRPLPYTLELDGRQLQLDAMLVAVGNGPSFGGGLRITEGALLDDGLLDVVDLPADEPRRAGPRVPEALHGHPHHAPAVRAPPSRQGDGGVARGSSPTPTANGSAQLPLTVECAPGALTVLA